MMLQFYYRKVGGKEIKKKVKRDRRVRAGHGHVERGGNEWGQSGNREARQGREHGQESEEGPDSPFYSGVGYLAIAR